MERATTDGPPALALSRRGLVVVWLGCTLLALALGAWMQPDHQDDTLIPVRYARHLLAGNGWVFNPGEHVNGSTSALNTLLTAALGLVLGERWILAQIVLFGLGLGALGFFVFLLFTTGAVPAFAAAAIAMALPFLYWAVGLETPLLLGLAAAATWAYARRRLRLCAFVLALAILARGDAALLAAVLIGHHLLAGWRAPRATLQRLAAPAGVFLLTMAPWAAFSLRTFGSVLPQTLAAKLAVTRSGLADLPGAPWSFFHAWWMHLGNFLGLRGPSFYIGPLSGPTVAVLVAGLLGFLVAIVRRHACWPLLVFGLAQFAVYAWLNLPGHLWYYVPLHLTIALSVAVLVETAWRWRLLRPVAMLLAGAWLFVAVPQRWPRPASEPAVPSTFYRGYHEAAAWIRAHVPEGRSIACVEVGVLGYVLPKHVLVDMVGLVTAGGVEAIGRRDFAWWLGRRPDWILLHEPPWPGLEAAGAAAPEFGASYEKRQAVGGLVMFARR